MKALHLLVGSAAMSALLILAAAEADARERAVGGGPRITLPSHANHFSWEGKHGGGKHGFHGGFFVVEREVPVIVEREVVREVPVVVQPVAPAPPRKPYVIGSNYASLPPQGCMKLIDDGASYYYCSGEWYRQTGGGRDAKYKAVAKP